MITMGKRSSKDFRITGIDLIGFFLMAGGIYHLIGISDYGFYQFMFQQLASRAIFYRYIVSVLFRLITIAAGLGLVLRKEAFRKFAIGLAVYMLCTVYWKHPFYVFENLAIYSEYHVWDTSGHYPLAYPWHPYISMGFYYVMDIVFSLAVLIYLRKDAVKQQFHSRR